VVADTHDAARARTAYPRIAVRVIPFRVAPFDNGMYVVVDGRRDAIVVDPSMAEAEVLGAVREEGLRLLAILNTHGHPDHIYANAAVKEATRARLAIHRLDAYRLDAATRPRISPESAALPGGPLGDVPPATADDLIDEGPLTYLRDVDLVALHTPGHTEGSTCYHLPSERVLFSGDVLFAGNVGRVRAFERLRSGGDCGLCRRRVIIGSMTLPHPPVIIGLAGGTGSGKTTVANAILKKVGAERISVVPHDAYYRNLTQLPRAQRDVLNFDHPDSLETDLLIQHIRQLKSPFFIRKFIWLDQIVTIPTFLPIKQLSSGNIFL